jgi:hypothetical protein
MKLFYINLHQVSKKCEMRHTVKRNLSRLAGMAAVLAITAACKSSSTVTYAPTVSLNLSTYRPPIPQPEQENTSSVTSDTPVQPSDRAEVSISGSIQSQLNAMSETMAAGNKNLKFSQGYRILLYSGGNRDEANKIITEVRKITSEVPELVYEQPNFRVKLGNFFAKTDAFALYTQIKSSYPNASIIHDRITIPIEKYRSN